MNIFSGFMDFLSQYNVIGVAVWLLIATKVGALVSSVIDDLVTPMILSPILTKLKVKKIEDLSYKWILYGKIMAQFIDFFITALIIFLFVKYADITIVKK
jgi:large conductance mechanosensitive channel